MPFYPGPGVGGHCIPIDPFYLSWKAREYGFDTRFIELAGQVNDDMPGYIVERCVELLAEAAVPLEGCRILMLGMAFKKNVSDVRESAAVRVAEQLMLRGAEVSFHDPWVNRVKLGASEVQSTSLTADSLHQADLTVITTDHDDVDYGLVVDAARLIYDTRNAIQVRLPHVHVLGAPQSVTGERFVPKTPQQEVGPAILGG